MCQNPMSLPPVGRLNAACALAALHIVWSLDTFSGWSYLEHDRSSQAGQTAIVPYGRARYGFWGNEDIGQGRDWRN